MAAYKDTERGTWYVSFHYYDWTGKNKRKLKRGKLRGDLRPNGKQQSGNGISV